MEEFVGKLLTGLAAFAGIAAWDVARTWIFSRWMVRRITAGHDAERGAARGAECPKCGAKIKVSITPDEPN